MYNAGEPKIHTLLDEIMPRQFSEVSPANNSLGQNQRIQN